ncbi:MAG: DNA alkylation repair protein [Chitinophagaceae bacterium]
MATELKQIQQLLLSNSQEKNHDYFLKMIPGEQKIYGVKTPVLNEIVKQFKAGSFGLAEELWKAGSFEERIIAVKIMEKKGKDDPERLLKLFKQFSKHVDNWAVCDGLGMQFLRGAVKTHAKEIFEIANQFSTSKNRWQRRLSLVMVEWYTRNKEYHPSINKLVNRLENDEEYYVRKAVAWIKRNFAKDK